ncbi:hypothetical protein CDL15_Pgr026580 [Punica granatum]|uniref:Uncharacterized protein n=1 Tax=Punica granatum TaxID=22663 RepID=A0A218WMM2_PUNGR|nr:hypothetical protein CDL15_Pgr026580 [Punica granatum]
MDPTSPKPAAVVLSVECLRGSCTADEWTGGLLQTGDIVEELTVGNSPSLRAPFKKGAAGVQKVLRRSYERNETFVLVRVRRGTGRPAELQACIVPDDSAAAAKKKKKKKKQCELRAISDPNYAFGFYDRTETDCLRLQASRNTRMLNELYSAPLQDGYVSYSWERKMQETLLVPNSSCFLYSFPPARANGWLQASQASGVPLVFMNIQTESLLTKISGGAASSKVNSGSLSDMSNIATTSLYGFEDYHGVDIGVARAVRLWHAPLGGEFVIEIKIKDCDIKLGFALSRMEEGFIYISSVDEDEDTPSTRSGLSHLYREAKSSARLLVISRISNQKVHPWLVSSTGAIRCYDTISLSHKLSLHRRAKVPIIVHLFSWDKERGGSSSSSLKTNLSRPLNSTEPDISLARDQDEYQVLQAIPSLQRDAAAELSFRFRDFSIPDI